jgi:teichuronic acid biosynthesis glycosyltransferase TuaC
MKILIVISGNSGQISPFVKEQIESVEKLGVEFEAFNILGNGLFGYLNNVKRLHSKIKTYKPDLVHAHYGLSGMLSILAIGSYPQVTTFHGNDINPVDPFRKYKINWNRLISKIVYRLSTHSIFVSEDLKASLGANPSKSDIIPCGVNLIDFYQVDTSSARKKLNLHQTKKLALFSSSFSTYIKNYPLAERSVNLIPNLELIELKGFSRAEVNLLLNSCDLALLTSFNEGSNQFLKEAMACNRPIVSTKVGDAELLFGNTKGCYLTSFEPEDIAEKIKLALYFGEHIGQTSGRDRIIELGLDSESVAKKIFEVYKKGLGRN